MGLWEERPGGPEKEKGLRMKVNEYETHIICICELGIEICEETGIILSRSFIGVTDILLKSFPI